MLDGSDAVEEPLAGEMSEWLLTYLRTEEQQSPENERCCIRMAPPEEVARIRDTVDAAIREGAMITEALGSSELAHKILTFRIVQALLLVCPTLTQTRAMSLVGGVVQNAMRDGNEFDPAKLATVTYGILQRDAMERFGMLITDQGMGFDLERVPNPLHWKYLERDRGRGLQGVNGILHRLEGAATYIPMDVGSLQTNTVLLEMPLQGSLSYVESFREWYTNLLRIDEELCMQHHSPIIASVE